jgi:hypothetical protein
LKLSLKRSRDSEIEVKSNKAPSGSVIAVLTHILVSALKSDASLAAFSIVAMCFIGQYMLIDKIISHHILPIEYDTVLYACTTVPITSQPASLNIYAQVLFISVNVAADSVAVRCVVPHIGTRSLSFVVQVLNGGLDLMGALMHYSLNC